MILSFSNIVLNPDMIQWERLKRAGMAPGPRASFGMAAHRTRAILFGGITDQRGKVRYCPRARLATQRVSTDLLGGQSWLSGDHILAHGHGWGSRRAMSGAVRAPAPKP